MIFMVFYDNIKKYLQSKIKGLVLELIELYLLNDEPGTAAGLFQPHFKSFGPEDIIVDFSDFSMQDLLALGHAQSRQAQRQPQRAEHARVAQT